MHFRIALCLLLALMVMPLMAQKKTPKKKKATTQVVDKLPVYLDGGQEGVYKIFADSMVYPTAAREERVGGRILVKFNVDTLGKVFDIAIAEGIRKDLDDEALRLVKMLKRWKPAYSKGRKVRVEMKLPLYFFPDVNFQREWEKTNKK